MSRTEAIEHYREALRRGQKYYHACVSQGSFPYPQVLENIFPESRAAARQDLGVLEIPADAIVGTLADGRKA
ncbi:MAG: BMP family ABC transporter substrate-binding protein, partial [Clostridia bacterium]|nr:BMP family ABC transporter substrate-binding protein [Clostridia bacterium]